MFKLFFAMIMLAAVTAQSSTDEPNKCSKNEEWNLCGRLCEPTCEIPVPNSRLCPAIVCTKFTARCRCKKGYVRDHHDKCVLDGVCPRN